MQKEIWLLEAEDFNLNNFEVESYPLNQRKTGLVSAPQIRGI